MDKKKIINILLNERPKDLLSLMTGEWDGSSCFVSGGVEHRRAIHHVKFVIEFGFEKDVVELEGQTYLANPDIFNEWVANGCQGLPGRDLALYLSENPLGPREVK